MKVLIIILIIFLIIVLLGFFPVNVTVSYIDKKFFYQVKYLSLIIMSSEKKNSFTWLVKKSVKDETEKQAVKEAEKRDIKKSEETKSDKKSHSKIEKTGIKSRLKKRFSGDKDSLMDNIVMVKDILILSKKHIGWLLRHIGVKDIYINFIVADEDAYECAMKYGKVSILLYNILGFISSFFRVSKKDIFVGCRFNHNESIYDASCRVTLRPVMAGTAFFGILFAFAVNTIKKNRLDKLSHKNAVKA